MKQNGTSLFHLMRFASPSLPIGAFAYSQGLESAIELGWVSDRGSMSDWALGLMSHSLAFNDLAVLKRLIEAKREDNKIAFEHYNQFIFALRETDELLNEELQLGRTLKRLLTEVESPKNLCRLIDTTPLSFVAAFAIAVERPEISIEDMLSVYLWAWLENQVSAAIKTIPLGQTDGQKILQQAYTVVPGVIDKAMTISEEELGSSAPALAIASSFHETQYSRLFRS